MGLSSSANARCLWLVPLCCALALALLSPAPARAFPGYFNNLPNGAVLVTAAAPDRCTLCHTITSPGTCVAMGMTSPCLNAAFGTPFMATHTWTLALAGADLDGDGFSNGQELQDPAGAWTMDAAAPGVAAYVTSPFNAGENPGLRDADMDHVCWFGRDTNNDFLCTGAGEKIADRDCDDSNPSRHSGAEELCDGADQDCDGQNDEGLADCDPGVGSCGAGQGENKNGDCFPREQIDGDRDGYCYAGQDLSSPADWDCSDAGEQNGAADCDEFDDEVYPGATETCLDGVDNDCNDLTDADDSACAAYVDVDGDGFCPMGADADEDHQCDTEEEAEAEGRDCDETDSTINPTATELCTSGDDENCDGLLDGRDEACGEYRDEDRDGFCPAGRDEDGDFLCDASGEPDAEAGDCDDALPNVFAGAPENCIDKRDNDCDGDSDEDDACVSDVDADEDGYCPLGRDLSKPLDGDCTDDGEDQAVSDCDDDDDDTSPAAVENCADRIDNDCDGAVDLVDDDCKRLLDADGDAYCPAGQDTNGDGDCLDFDEARPIHDCDDDDPLRRPRIGEHCTDGVDNDCNGEIDGFDPFCFCDDDEACPVSEPCMVGRCVVGVGCQVVADPACGESDDDAGASDESDRDDDAGTDTHGGHGNDAGVMPPPPELEEVGCGCRLVGARRESGAAPLLLLGLALALRLRRRSIG